MTLVCFASQKGSPGATAAALAVAAALRPGSGRRKLLLEADGSGGTLALRYGLASEPGLVTLAAAIRAGIEPEGLWRHAQELPGGLPVVVCPDGSDQVHAALGACGARLGRHLAQLPDVDVICDVGRLGPGSPAGDLVAEATAVLLVARPVAEQLQPAARRMLGLRSEIRNLGWVLIGDEPYGPAEVEATFGLPVVGVIADDRRSVRAIEQGAMSKRLRRHPFVRSATTLAEVLADWLAPLADPWPSDLPAGPVPSTEPVSPVAEPASPVAEPVSRAAEPASPVAEPVLPETVPSEPRPLFAVGPPTYGGTRPAAERAPEPPAPRSPGYAWAPAPPAPPSDRAGPPAPPPERSGRADRPSPDRPADPTVKPVVHRTERSRS